MNVKFVLLIVLLYITNSSSEKMSGEEEKNAFSNVSNSCRHFTNTFYQTLSKDIQSNIICSPFSLYSILSLLSHGTAKETLSELQKVLHQIDKQIPHEEHKSLLSLLNAIEDVELQIANAIYVPDNFEILPHFMTISTDIFNCSTTRMNFKDSKKAINEINSWVKQATRDKISDIVSSDDINEDTKVILVNAIYFRGKWLNHFNKDLTEKRAFHMSKTQKKLIPMMFKKSKYFHGELPSLETTFLEIPYLNKDVVMIILLPNKVDGLEFLEKNFKLETLLTAERINTQVELYLPKFKYEVTIDLKSILRKLDLNVMFEDQADFTQLTNEPVKVSKVVQKAFIEVNEEGSEVAVVTDVMVRLKRMMSMPEEFVVDHPFMFVVHHKSSNIPLFLGSVKDIHVPIEKEEL